MEIEKIEIPNMPLHVEPTPSLFAKVRLFYMGTWSDSKHWFRLVSIWFLIGAIIGGVVFFVAPGIFEEIIKGFAGKFGDDPPLNFDLVIAIFLNNLKASGVALAGGLLVGAGPFVIVMTNAFILGYILVAVISLSPDNLVQTIMMMLVGILPHGVIEIPAFLLAAALGLRLGIDWLKKENYGHRMKVLKTSIKQILYAGAPLIIVLLFIAALIEVYVSGTLLEKIV